MRWLEVPVSGGALAVARWGDGPAVVALVHGITATSLHWGLVAEIVVELAGDRVSVVAPDLRGRGASRGLVGPFGAPAHAADVVAVLDHVGADRAVVAGHSMGGFVAAVLAATEPERVERAVLVDGGWPFDDGLPEGASIDAVLEAVIGPAMRRLSMTFDSPAAYEAFWAEHPALSASDAWDSHVAPALRHDLWFDAAAEAWRPTAAVEQVREDGRDVLASELTRSAGERLEGPATFLWCPLGLLGQAPGLYPPDTVRAWASRHPHVEVAQVPDTNHYTVLLSRAGARTVAERIVAVLPA